jgi:hypothetical protein
MSTQRIKAALIPTLLTALLLAAALGAALAPAFARAHAARAAGQSSHAPLCSGTGCDFTDPYKELCAGQWWDSWWVVATAPMVDARGRAAGYVQLWWSATCQTNWTRAIDQLAQPGVMITHLQDLATNRGDSNQTQGRAAGTRQLYLPQSPASAQGLVELSGDTYTGSVNQDAITVVGQP